MSWIESIHNRAPGCLQSPGAPARRGAAILLLCLAGLWSCGIKAPPLPPPGGQAPPVVDLRYELDGPVFSLTWDLPDAETSRFAAAESCRVHRAKTPLGDSTCPGCAPAFETAADIAAGDGSAAGTPMQYTETLDAGFEYTYKVVCFTENGISGDPSDFVTVSY